MRWLCNLFLYAVCHPNDRKILNLSAWFSVLDPWLCFAVPLLSYVFVYYFFDRISVGSTSAQSVNLPYKRLFTISQNALLLGPVVNERTASSLDFNPTSWLWPLLLDKDFLPCWALYSPPTSRQQHNNNSDPALLLPAACYTQDIQ